MSDIKFIWFILLILVIIVAFVEIANNSEKTVNENTDGIILEPTYEQIEIVEIPKKDLFYAIAEVESNHNDNVIGDNGKSKGRYQIGKDYWKDACEYLDVDLDYDTCVIKPCICRVIMEAYWRRYKATTIEMKVRIHNGGPDGYTQKCTLSYWNKVKKVLERIKNEN